MSAEEYSAGFDRGNYCSAYEATSIDERHELAWSGDWREGFVMGFFSSYELHEVPGQLARGGRAPTYQVELIHDQDVE